MSCETHSILSRGCEGCFDRLATRVSKLIIELDTVRHELAMRKSGEKAAIQMLEALSTGFDENK